VDCVDSYSSALGVQEAMSPIAAEVFSIYRLGLLSLVLSSAAGFHFQPATHHLSVRPCSAASLCMQGMPGAGVSSAGVNEYNVDIDGAGCQNGRLGKVIYEKILQDQKRLYKARPMPGFKAGAIPPQVCVCLVGFF
jgi:hypothetical protein